MERRKRCGTGWVVLAGLLLMTGCGDQLAAIRDKLTGFLLPLTPRQAYLRSAKQQDLLDSARIAGWEAAYRAALADSVFVDSPFRERLRYTSDAAVTAASYRLFLPAGRSLTVGITDSPSGVPVFGELYPGDVAADPRPEDALARWDTLDQHLRYEELDPAGRELLLVVQSAPTDSSGGYTLFLRTDPVLTFPVAGKDERAIQSFWGDSRSGGERRHEGNDIFAPRGTPVVAVTDARVRSTRETERGGKTVWLRDAEGRGLAYYYAHLDSQLVADGDFVERGDTVGLVGNTGNARTTPPHLHFGIYRRGARDPWAYLRNPDPSAPAVRLATEFPPAVPDRGRYYLRREPRASRAVIRRPLDNGEPITIIGQTDRYYRLRTQAGEVGYVQWE